MKRGCNWVLWGLVLETFHITLGSVQILPAFAGGFMIAYGIWQLQMENSVPELNWTFRVFCAFGIWGAVLWLFAWVGIGARYEYLMTTVLLVLEFTGYYMLFEELGSAAEDKAKKRYYCICQRWMIAGMALACTAQCTASFLQEESNMWTALAVILIARLSMWSFFTRLKSADRAAA